METVCGYLGLACFLTLVPVASFWGMEGLKWWGIFWGFTLSVSMILCQHADRLEIKSGVDLLAVLEFVLLVPTLIVAIVCGGGEGFKWWGIFWGFAMGVTSMAWNALHRSR